MHTVVLHSVEASRQFLTKNEVSATHYTSYRRPEAINKWLAKTGARSRALKTLVLGAVLSAERLMRIPTHRAVAAAIRDTAPLMVALNNQFDAALMSLIGRLGFARRTLIHARGLCPHRDLVGITTPPLIIAMSRAVATSYISAGWPSDRTEVIYDPVPIYSAPPPPADWPSLSGGRRVVAMVGSLQTWKGQAVFVDAAAITASRHPDVRFLIVGGETLAEPEFPSSLAAKIRDRGLNGVVHITGWRTDADAIMAASTIVVHASIRPEPFGYVVPEALSFGVPVIAANAGGPTEVIRHGIDGLLTEPGDSAALVEAISTLLSNDTLRRDVGAQGRCRVQDFLSEERFAAAMRRVYDRVLTESGLDPAYAFVAGRSRSGAEPAR
jgi:glycosyltransferase involved in cell wall biosynthesis